MQHAERGLQEHGLCGPYLQCQRRLELHIFMYAAALLKEMVAGRVLGTGADAAGVHACG